MQAIPFENLQANAAKLIGKQWMLVTAGQAGTDNSLFNTMTASWGGLGFLWNRPVAYVFVRPNRHTAEFLNKEASFTLSFMPEQYRKDLMFCGRNSGRDGDKLASTQLIPCATPNGLPAFEDADIILECRKLYKQSMAESSFENWSEVSPSFYAEDNPLHDLYIAEITACYLRPTC